MNRKAYNGHTNYETWLMALWLDQDEDTGQTVEEVGRDPLKVASRLEEEIKDEMPEIGNPWEGFLHSALTEVDWRDVARHLIRRAKE